MASHRLMAATLSLAALAVSAGAMSTITAYVCEPAGSCVPVAPRVRVAPTSPTQIVVNMTGLLNVESDGSRRDKPVPSLFSLVDAFVLEEDGSLHTAVQPRAFLVEASQRDEHGFAIRYALSPSPLFMKTLAGRNLVFRLRSTAELSNVTGIPASSFFGIEGEAVVPYGWAPSVHLATTPDCTNAVGSRMHAWQKQDFEMPKELYLCISAAETGYTLDVSSARSLSLHQILSLSCSVTGAGAVVGKEPPCMPCPAQDDLQDSSPTLIEEEGGDVLVHRVAMKDQSMPLSPGSYDLRLKKGVWTGIKTHGAKGGEGVVGAGAPRNMQAAGTIRSASQALAFNVYVPLVLRALMQAPEAGPGRFVDVQLQIEPSVTGVTTTSTPTGVHGVPPAAMTPIAAPATVVLAVSLGNAELWGTSHGKCLFKALASAPYTSVFTLWPHGGQGVGAGGEGGAHVLPVVDVDTQAGHVRYTVAVKEPGQYTFSLPQSGGLPRVGPVQGSLMTSPAHLAQAHPTTPTPNANATTTTGSTGLGVASTAAVTITVGFQPTLIFVAGADAESARVLAHDEPITPEHAYVGLRVYLPAEVGAHGQAGRRLHESGVVSAAAAAMLSRPAFHSAVSISSHASEAVYASLDRSLEASVSPHSRGLSGEGQDQVQGELSTRHHRVLHAIHERTDVQHVTAKVHTRRGIAGLVGSLLNSAGTAASRMLGGWWGEAQKTAEPNRGQSAAEEEAAKLDEQLTGRTYFEYALAVGEHVPRGRYTVSVSGGVFSAGGGLVNAPAARMLTNSDTVTIYTPLTSYMLDTYNKLFLIRVQRKIACSSVESSAFNVVVKVPCSPPVGGGEGQAPPTECQTDTDKEDPTKPCVFVQQQPIRSTDGSYTRETVPVTANLPNLQAAGSAGAPQPKCEEEGQGSGKFYYSLSATGGPLAAGSAEVVAVRIPVGVWSTVSSVLEVEEEAVKKGTLTRDKQDEASEDGLNTVKFAIFDVADEENASPVGSWTSVTYSRLVRRFNKDAKMHCSARGPDSGHISVDEWWHEAPEDRPENDAIPGMPLPPAALAMLYTSAASATAMEVTVETPCSSTNVIRTFQVSCNTPPTVNVTATPKQLAFVSDAARRKVILDARTTEDPDGDAISLRWRIVSKPPASLTTDGAQFVQVAREEKDKSTPGATKMVSDATYVFFTPDVGGEFVVELSVSDGCSTTSSRVVINVVCSATSKAFSTIEAVSAESSADVTAATALKPPSYSFKLRAPLSEYLHDGSTKLAYSWDIVGLRPRALEEQYAIDVRGVTYQPGEQRFVAVAPGASYTEDVEASGTTPASVTRFIDCVAAATEARSITEPPTTTDTVTLLPLLDSHDDAYGSDGLGWNPEATSCPISSPTSSVTKGQAVSVTTEYSVTRRSTRTLLLEPRKLLDTIKILNSDKPEATLVVPETSVRCRVPMQVRLRVFDECRREYTSSTLWIDPPACGAAPVAVAGSDTYILSDPTAPADKPFPAVLLDGRGSYDNDTAVSFLQFSWAGEPGNALSAGIKPTTVSAAQRQVARVTPKLPGVYEYRLVVSDGCTRSEDVYDSVRITAVCRPFAAKVSTVLDTTTANKVTVTSATSLSVLAGNNIKLKAEATLQSVSIPGYGTVGPDSILDPAGCSTSQPFGGQVLRQRTTTNPPNFVHAWELVNKPDSSALRLGSADIIVSSSGGVSTVAGFRPDTPGSYTIQYTVKDNCNNEGVSMMYTVTATCDTVVPAAGVIAGSHATMTLSPAADARCTAPRLVDYLSGTYLTNPTTSNTQLRPTVTLYWRGRTLGFPGFTMAGDGATLGGAVVARGSITAGSALRVSWSSPTHSSLFPKQDQKLRYVVPDSPKLFTSPSNVTFRATYNLVGCPAVSATTTVDLRCNIAELWSEWTLSFSQAWRTNTGNSNLNGKVVTTSRCSWPNAAVPLLYDGWAGRYAQVRLEAKGSYTLLDPTNTAWLGSIGRSEGRFEYRLAYLETGKSVATVEGFSSTLADAAYESKVTWTPVSGVPANGQKPLASQYNLTFEFTDDCMPARQGGMSLAPMCPSFAVGISSDCASSGGNAPGVWNFKQQRFNPVTVRVEPRYTQPGYLAANPLAVFPEAGNHLQMQVRFEPKASSNAIIQLLAPAVPLLYTTRDTPATRIRKVHDPATKRCALKGDMQFDLGSNNGTDVSMADGIAPRGPFGRAAAVMYFRTVKAEATLIITTCPARRGAPTIGFRNVPRTSPQYGQRYTIAIRGRVTRLETDSSVRDPRVLAAQAVSVTPTVTETLCYCDTTSCGKASTDTGVVAVAANRITASLSTPGLYVLELFQDHNAPPLALEDRTMTWESALTQLRAAVAIDRNGNDDACVYPEQSGNQGTEAMLYNYGGFAYSAVTFAKVVEGSQTGPAVRALATVNPPFAGTYPLTAQVDDGCGRATSQVLTVRASCRDMRLEAWVYRADTTGPNGALEVTGAALGSQAVFKRAGLTALPRFLLRALAFYQDQAPLVSPSSWPPSGNDDISKKLSDWERDYHFVDVGSTSNGATLGSIDWQGTFKPKGSSAAPVPVPSESFRDGSAPYEKTFVPVGEGLYQFTATASDGCGGTFAATCANFSVEFVCADMRLTRTVPPVPSGILTLAFSGSGWTPQQLVMQGENEDPQNAGQWVSLDMTENTVTFLAEVTKITSGKTDLSAYGDDIPVTTSFYDGDLPTDGVKEWRNAAATIKPSSNTGNLYAGTVDIYPVQPADEIKITAIVNDGCVRRETSFLLKATCDHSLYFLWTTILDEVAYSKNTGTMWTAAQSGNVIFKEAGDTAWPTVRIVTKTAYRFGYSGSDPDGGKPVSELTAPGRRFRVTAFDFPGKEEGRISPTLTCYAEDDSRTSLTNLNGCRSDTRDVGQIEFTPSESGEYAFEVEVFDGCITNSYIVTLTVVDKSLIPSAGTGDGIDLTDRSTIPFSDRCKTFAVAVATTDAGASITNPITPTADKSKFRSATISAGKSFRLSAPFSLAENDPFMFPYVAFWINDSPVGSEWAVLEDTGVSNDLSATFTPDVTGEYTIGVFVVAAKTTGDMGPNWADICSYSIDYVTVYADCGFNPGERASAPTTDTINDCITMYTPKTSKPAQCSSSIIDLTRVFLDSGSLRPDIGGQTLIGPGTDNPSTLRAAPGGAKYFVADVFYQGWKEDDPFSTVDVRFEVDLADLKTLLGVTDDFIFYGRYFLVDYPLAWGEPEYTDYQDKTMDEGGLLYVYFDTSLNPTSYFFTMRFKAPMITALETERYVFALELWNGPTRECLTTTLPIVIRVQCGSDINVKLADSAGSSFIDPNYGLTSTSPVILSWNGYGFDSVGLRLDPSEVYKTDPADGTTQVLLTSGSDADEYLAQVTATPQNGLSVMAFTGWMWVWTSLRSANQQRTIALSLYDGCVRQDVTIYVKTECDTVIVPNLDAYELDVSDTDSDGEFDEYTFTSLSLVGGASPDTYTVEYDEDQDKYPLVWLDPWASTGDRNNGQVTVDPMPPDRVTYVVVGPDVSATPDVALPAGLKSTDPLYELTQDGTYAYFRPLVPGDFEITSTHQDACNTGTNLKKTVIIRATCNGNVDDNSDCSEMVVCTARPSINVTAYGSDFITGGPVYFRSGSYDSAYIDASGSIIVDRAGNYLPPGWGSDVGNGYALYLPPDFEVKDYCPDADAAPGSCPSGAVLPTGYTSKADVIEDAEDSLFSWGYFGYFSAPAPGVYTIRVTMSSYPDGGNPTPCDTVYQEVRIKATCLPGAVCGCPEIRPSVTVKAGTSSLTIDRAQPTGSESDRSSPDYYKTDSTPQFDYTVAFQESADSAADTSASYALGGWPKVTLDASVVVGTIPRSGGTPTSLSTAGDRLTSSGELQVADTELIVLRVPFDSGLYKYSIYAANASSVNASVALRADRRAEPGSVKRNTFVFTPDTEGWYEFMLWQPSLNALGCADKYVYINVYASCSIGASKPVCIPSLGTGGGGGSGDAGSCNTQYTLSLDALPTAPTRTVGTGASAKTYLLSTWDGIANYRPVLFRITVTATDAVSGTAVDLSSPTAPRLYMGTYTADADLDKVYGNGVTDVEAGSYSFLLRVPYTFTLPLAVSGLTPFGLTSLNNSLAGGYLSSRAIWPYLAYEGFDNHWINGSLAFVPTASSVKPSYITGAGLGDSPYKLLARVYDTEGCSSNLVTKQILAQCNVEPPILGYYKYQPDGCTPSSSSCPYAIQLTPQVSVGGARYTSIDWRTPYGQDPVIQVPYSSTQGRFARVLINAGVSSTIVAFDGNTFEEFKPGSSGFRAEVQRRVIAVVKRPDGASFELRAALESLGKMDIGTDEATDSFLDVGGVLDWGDSDVTPYGSTPVANQNTVFVGKRPANTGISTKGLPILEFYCSSTGFYHVSFRYFFKAPYDACATERTVVFHCLPGPSGPVVGIIPEPVAPSSSSTGAVSSIEASTCSSQIEARKRAGRSCKCDSVTAVLSTGVSSRFIWRGDKWTPVTFDVKKSNATDGCNGEPYQCGEYTFGSYSYAVPSTPVAPTGYTGAIIDSTLSSDGKTITYKPNNAWKTPGNFTVAFVGQHRAPQQSSCPPVFSSIQVRAVCPLLEARPRVSYLDNALNVMLPVQDTNTDPLTPAVWPASSKLAYSAPVVVYVPLKRFDGTEVTLDALASVVLDPAAGNAAKPITAYALSKNSAFVDADGTKGVQTISTFTWSVVSEPGNPLLNTSIVPDRVRRLLDGAHGKVRSSGTDYKLTATAPKTVAQQIADALAAGNPQTLAVSGIAVRLYFIGEYELTLTISDGCTTTTRRLVIKATCDSLLAPGAAAVTLAVPESDAATDKLVEPVKDPNGRLLTYFLPFAGDSVRTVKLTARIQPTPYATGCTVNPLDTTASNGYYWLWAKANGKILEYGYASTSRLLSEGAEGEEDMPGWEDEDGDSFADRSTLARRKLSVPAPAARRLDEDNSEPHKYVLSSGVDMPFLLDVATSAFDAGTPNTVGQANVASFTVVAVGPCRVPFFVDFTVAGVCQPLPVSLDTSVSTRAVWSVDDGFQARARVTWPETVVDAGKLKVVWRLDAAPAGSRFAATSVPTGCVWSQSTQSAGNVGVLSVVHTCPITTNGATNDVTLPVLFDSSDRTGTPPKDVEMQTVTLAADVPGVYRFTATVSDGCAVSTVTVTFEAVAPTIFPPTAPRSQFVWDSTARQWTAQNVPSVPLQPIPQYTPDLSGDGCTSTPSATFYADFSVRPGEGGSFPDLLLPGFSQQTAAVALGSAGAQLYTDGSTAVDQMAVNVLWRVTQAPMGSRYSALAYAKTAAGKAGPASLPFSAAATDAGMPALLYVPQPKTLSFESGTLVARLSKAIRSSYSDVTVTMASTTPEEGLTGAVNLVSGAHLRQTFSPDVEGVFVVDAVVSDLAPQARGVSVDAPSVEGEVGGWLNGMPLPSSAACPTVIRHIISARCAVPLKARIPEDMSSRTVTLSGTSFEYVPVLYREGLQEGSPLWSSTDPNGLDISMGPTVVARWVTHEAPEGVAPASVSIANPYSVYSASFIPRDTGTYVFMLTVVDTRCPAKSINATVTIHVNCKARLATVELQTLSLGLAGFGRGVEGDGVVYSQNSTVVARLAAQYTLEDPSVAPDTPVHYSWRIVTAEALEFRRRRGDKAAGSAAGIAAPGSTKASKTYFGLSGSTAAGIAVGVVVALIIILVMCLRRCRQNVAEGRRCWAPPTTLPLWKKALFVLSCGLLVRRPPPPLSKKKGEFDPTAPITFTSLGAAGSPLPPARSTSATRSLATGAKMADMRSVLANLGRVGPVSPFNGGGGAGAGGLRAAFSEQGNMGITPVSFGAFSSGGDANGFGNPLVVASNPMVSLDAYRSSSTPRLPAALTASGESTTPTANGKDDKNRNQGNKASFDVNTARASLRNSAFETAKAAFEANPALPRRKSDVRSVLGRGGEDSSSVPGSPSRGSSATPSKGSSAV